MTFAPALRACAGPVKPFAADGQGRALLISHQGHEHSKLPGESKAEAPFCWLITRGTLKSYQVTAAKGEIPWNGPYEELTTIREEASLEGQVAV